LEVGSRLGHFSILGLLGRGGMGEVWRARDSVLGREVALKTLPREFAQDPERLARFEREARLIAAVSHPHIGGIYGLEQHAEERFLVLELIEGETLADRLFRGALPITEALKLALQLAEALEAAHDKGVIHRDLKPANIKITPDGKLKVLDFGLAKALMRDADAAQTVTAQRDPTEVGAILGTPAYMAPEQARGEPAGVRADVWAFGCVLHEMLTGRGTFDGRTASDVLANVLKAEPDWQRLPQDLHPRIRYLLERCLEKEPRNRYVGIADARVEIEKALADRGGVAGSTVSAAQDARRSTVRLIAAAVAAMLVAAAAGTASIWSMNRSTNAEAVVRFSEPLAEAPVSSALLQISLVDISPDGKRVAYATGTRIFIRDLNDAEAHPLQDVAGILTQPRFSPDGRWLLYLEGPAPYSLKMIPVGGGSPKTVVSGIEDTAYNPEWAGPDSLLIVLAAGLTQVWIEGGMSRLVVPSVEGEQIGSPHLLPGGDRVLFTVTSGDGARRWDAGEVVVQSLGTGERHVVLRGGSDARYAASGHLVYARGSALFAVPFDLARAEVTGESATVIERVTRGRGDDPLTDTAQYAISNGGTLVYVDFAASSTLPRGLAWVGRDGKAEPIAVAPADFTYARVSPDGASAALVVGHFLDAGRNPDIWVLDLKTQSLRQLTFDFVADSPVWSPDGRRIYFRGRGRGGSADRTAIYAVTPEGGDPELIAAGSGDFVFALPYAVSADGQTLLVTKTRSFASVGIGMLTLRDRQFGEVLHTGPRQINPSYEPNGAWIAYEDQGQLDLRPFPDVQRTRVPVGAGQHPVFSRDGAELFYFYAGGIAAASVELAPNVQVGASRTLFRATYWYGGNGPDGTFGRAWDPHPDGNRFLIILAPDESDAPARLHVVVNWFEELEQRAPKR
jgi:eukaryotic-like serine/threonine-protein kinase